MEKQFLNEEIHLRNLSFFLLLIIFQLCNLVGEDQKTFTYACTTLLLWVKSENSHIYQAKEKRCIFDVLVWLWQQSWHLRILMLLNEFAKLLIEEPCSFFFLISPPLSSHIITDMVEEFAVLGSKYCAVCKLCYFTIHLDLHSPELQTVSLQSHGLMFWMNPSRMAGKYIFFAIFTLLWLLLTKSAKKWIRKINIIGLTTLTYP